jgi:hypothetical protein
LGWPPCKTPTASRRRRSGGLALDVLTRRDYLDPIEILRVLRTPDRREVQADGRIRLWGYSPTLQGYLRVVVLSDGETVHNAFIDEDFG